MNKATKFLICHEGSNMVENTLIVRWYDTHTTNSHITVDIYGLGHYKLVFDCEHEALDYVYKYAGERKVYQQELD